MPRLAWVCVLVFATAVAVRTVYTVTATSAPGYRQTTHGELEDAAAHWAERGTMCDVHGPGTGASAHVSPLYPYLLKTIYEAFGVGSERARRVQEWLAVVVTSGGIALLPLLGRRGGMRMGAGVMAGFLLAVSPLNFWIECSGSWEQPYTALALIGLLWAYMGVHDDRWKAAWRIAVIALLMGVAALLSPVVLMVGIALLGVEWIGQRGRRMRVMGGAGMIAAVVGLFLTPWVMRNYRELGGFVPLRSNFGLELLIGNNPNANGMTWFVDPDRPDASKEVHPQVNADELKELQRVGELAYMRHKGEQAKKWIGEHPGEFVKLTIARFRLFWFPPADLWSPTTHLRGAKALFMGATAVLMFGGLILLFARKSAYRWHFVAVMGGYSLIYLITHVNGRYRYPILGLSVLLGCELVVRGIRWMRGLEEQRDVAGEVEYADVER